MEFLGDVQGRGYLLDDPRVEFRVVVYLYGGGQAETRDDLREEYVNCSVDPLFVVGKAEYLTLQRYLQILVNICVSCLGTYG